MCIVSGEQDEQMIYCVANGLFLLYNKSIVITHCHNKESYYHNHKLAKVPHVYMWQNIHTVSGFMGERKVLSGVGDEYKHGLAVPIKPTHTPQVQLG